MNARERTLLAMAHQEPDRVPTDFGGRHTTVHLYAHEALMKYLGYSGPPPNIRSYHTYLVDPDPQLQERFQAMSYVFYPKPPSSYTFHIDPATNTYYDEWGVKYYMPPDGYYYDMCQNPLPNASTEEDLHNYSWPDPADPSRMESIAARVKAAYEKGDRVVFIGAASNGLWEHAWYILGFENAFSSLAGNKPFMEAFTERFLEWNIAYWNMALDQVGPYVDLVQVNEDLGTQRSLMMSPATFRQIYKPRLRRLIDAIKKKTQARLYLHSCGAIYPLIGDLIDCGVEVLNPIQVNARDMDTARLKREFGQDLVFWGGGCDTVVLQQGTPAQVREEVQRRIRDLAPGGGFIFGSVHNIQANVPPENIVAMYDAAVELGQYPI